MRYLRLSVLAGDPGVWEMKVYAPSDAAPTDRELWVETLVKISDPVVTNLASGTLHRNFPRRKGTWTD